MNCFNTLDRPLLVQKINQSVYDLLIIGGGITGAGIALDAASRGFRTLLIEKNDFASGTSSKSTKLIHGGLRYLKQFEIALVREVGLERAIIHRLAPHLVKSEKMLLPLIKDGTYGKILTSVGLMVYDVLAGVEKADQRKMLTKEETLEEEMLIDESILEGGGIYAEYRTDDARLTIEVLKTAASYGADIINYAEALDFNYEAGTIAGIRWRDNLNRAENNTKGTYTVSATGPWVDELRAKNKSLTGKRLHPTKGVHIVVPHERFPVRHAIYFDVPDGRMIFAIPRGRATYVGTTDTDYFGDLNDVRVTREDVQYLVEGVNHIFPKVNLSVEEVESTWVGLRPLIGEEGKEASDLSRKDEIFESDTGLLSIAGGKLTGYRKMAERIVNLIVEKEKAEKPCMTEWISLNGGLFKGSVEVDTYTRQVERKLQNEGLAHLAAYLVGNYGRQTDLILEHFNALDGHIPDVRLGLAELEFCVHNEAVFSALDFLEHRTGRLFFDIHSISFLKEPVLDFLTNFFNWTDEKRAIERGLVEEAVYRATHFE